MSLGLKKFKNGDGGCFNFFVINKLCFVKYCYGDLYGVCFVYNSKFYIV